MTVSTVQVLLATRNGIRYLPEQLASIAAQTWPGIDLFISDDGSIDGTAECLEAFVAGWTRGKAQLVRGPSAGSAAANFHSLILSEGADADFTAFADQDDIWLPDKLENAVAAIAHEPGPALHCARTALIDETGREIGFSRYFRRPPDFRNALVQSLAGGNTMVMNRAAFALVRESSRRTPYASHDWWTYIIISGAGGTIVYSPIPDTRYRQHADNVTGANLGWHARLVRLRSLSRGRFKRWNDLNTTALAECRDMLSADARRALARFEAARTGPFWHRHVQLLRSGVYRQSLGGHVMLYVASLFDWV